jgi:hypothetical protein
MLKDLGLTAKEQVSLGKIFYDAFNKKPNVGKAIGMLEQFYHGRHSFVANDPYQTAFHEGQRDVFLTIVAAIAVYQSSVKEKK